MFLVRVLFAACSLYLSIADEFNSELRFSEQSEKDRRRTLHGKRLQDKEQIANIMTINHISLAAVSSDCTSSCSFPTPSSVTASNAVQSLSLTTSFTFSFDFQPSGTLAVISNIIEIVSVSLGSSLLAVSLEPQSVQVAVFYLGQKVLSYGPGASATGYTTFTISVSDTSISVSNGAYSVVSTTKIVAVESLSNTLYASGSGPSAGGTVKNIAIAGTFWLALLICISHD